MEAVANTSPLKNQEGQRLRRNFLGKTSDFKDKQEKSFYQKMLKYYAKGAQKMPFGHDQNGHKMYVAVEQIYFYA